MIIGVAGQIGSGKSFSQLKTALAWCERKEKQLITNFPLNLKALYHYCKLRRYTFCCEMIKKGAVSWIINPNDLQALFIPSSVVCLDEAGIFLNSRDFMNTSKALLADLVQSRKDGVDLIWAAQFQEQVDKQFRLLTQYWIHCNSVSVYNKPKKRPQLIWKRIYTFDAASYFKWCANIQDNDSHLKTRFIYSSDYEGGFLSTADKALFGAFDSMARLDKSASIDRICTFDRSDLADSYFRLALPLSDGAAYPSTQVSGSLLLRSPAQGIQVVSRYIPPSSESRRSAPAGRPALIKQALTLSRLKRIDAPFFKDLSDDEIKSFLADNA